MSLAALTSVLILLLDPISIDSQQTCVAVPDEVWPSNYNILPECSYRMIGRSGVAISYSDGIYRLEYNGIAQKLGTFGTPAQVSWSPNGESFYINDGRGSNVSSIFRFYRHRADGKYHVSDVNGLLDRTYKAKTHCTEIPNIWGSGWSKGGNVVHVYIAPILRGKCGAVSGTFEATIRLSDATILSFEPSAK